MSFRAGSAASWPSWTPTVRKYGGTCTLTVRSSPGSGLVFVAGSLSVTSPDLAFSTVTVSDSPAPATFRPRRTFVLDSGTYFGIDPDGNLVWNPSRAGMSGGQSIAVRTYYFADTPTP